MCYRNYVNEIRLVNLMRSIEWVILNVPVGTICGLEGIEEIVKYTTRPNFSKSIPLLGLSWSSISGLLRQAVCMVGVSAHI